MPDAQLQEELRTVSAMRVYFGHQSVGKSILDGIRELAVSHNVPEMRFVSLDSIPSTGEAYFAESRIGENHKPLLKCSAFQEALSALHGRSVDVAFMKFCYSDIVRDTEVRQVFAGYTKTIDSLKARYPNIRFVHVTIPLTVATSRLKKFISALIGREANLDVGNARRQEFNELLRAKYRHEPLFDLARIQATDPDGMPVTATLRGEPIPAMYEGYSADDGAHMNHEGARIAARALVHILASLSGPRL